MLKLNLAWTRLLAEFTGTFLFVLTIPLASLGVGKLSPIPIGFMLSAMTFTFGYISGGHFNPAITFAVVLIRKFKLSELWKYVLVQVFAYIMAGFYAAIIVGVNMPAPQALSLISVWKTVLTETVYSFAVTNVVLHCRYSRQRKNNFYGFAIGMTVLSAALAVGGFDSGAFNPAVATGTQFAMCTMAFNCAPLAMLWVFWAAPMAGAFLAAMFYNILDTGDKPVDPPRDNDNRLADFH